MTTWIPIQVFSKQFHGYIDLLTSNIYADLYAKYPLLRPIKLGPFTGNLIKGVQITFKAPGVSGTIGMVLRGRWLHIHFNVTVFKKNHVGDIRVLLLPV